VIACLYDVHGNLPALEAVLADIGDVDRYILGGDYALFGGWPSETVARLRELEPAEPNDEDAELLEGVTAPRLLFGHTHIAFRRMADGIELVNPGSVGIPLDGDHRAAYALVHEDGGVEHRRVAYDHEASAAKVRSFGGEWTETIARRIERARMEG
jgi:diadenosine tetraphosphatase ApaH/serine/threonine PP2A family protein phosphatase